MPDGVAGLLRPILHAELRACTILIDDLPRRSKAPSSLNLAIAYCRGTRLRGEIEAIDASRLQEATQRTAAICHYGPPSNGPGLSQFETALGRRLRRSAPACCPTNLRWCSPKRHCVGAVYADQ